MSTNKCRHTNRIAAKMDLEFSRPSEPKALYTAPVSVLICGECGHIEFHAALPRLLGDWLEER